MSTRFSIVRTAVSVKKLTTTSRLSDRYVKTRIEIVMSDNPRFLQKSVKANFMTRKVEMIM